MANAEGNLTTTDDTDIFNTSESNYSFWQDNNGTTTTTPRLPSVGVASPVIMSLVGILGNAMALLLLYTSKPEVKKTAYFTLLVGQAFSDMISYFVTGPIPIIVYANNLQWQGGMPVCYLSAIGLIGFGMVIPLFVACLSLERLLALRFPYFYARVVTVNKARLVFLSCWGFVFFFCFLPFMGVGSFGFQFPGTWCFLNFHNESTSDSVYAYLFAIFNITVMALTVTNNTMVVLTLVKMKRARRVAVSPGRLGNDRPQKSVFQMEMETQMVWFLCGVTTIFIFCWLPLNVQILINLTTGQINPTADLLAVRMASINQILDPWFYILLRKSVLVKMAAPFRKLFCRYTEDREQSTKVTHLQSGTKGSPQSTTT